MLKKREAPEGVLRDIEAFAVEAKKLPPGPDKDAYVKTLQQMANLALEKYQLPAEVIAPDSKLAEALQYIPGVSYLPGLVRTAVGESALASAGKSEGAYDRIKKAVVPDFPFAAQMLGEDSSFANSALSVGQYRDMLGGTKQLDEMPLFSKNEYFNPSVGGTLDTGLGMVLDPAILLGGLKALTKKAPPKTIAALEKQFADEMENFKKGPTVKGTVKGASEFMADPAKKAGEFLENSRFRDADLAAVDGGQRPLSAVWREGGKPGLTERGVELGKGRLMQQNSAVLKNLLEDIPTGEDLIARAKEFYTKTIGPEATAKIEFDDIPEQTLQIQLGYLKPRSEVMAPMYSEQVSKNIATEGLTEPTITAQKNLEDIFRKTAESDTSLVKEFSEARAAAAPEKLSRNPLTGEMEYKELRPGKNTSPDILEFKEKFYSPKELNAVASSMQGIAAASKPNIYNAPNPAMQVLNRTEQRLNPLFQRAEGDMAAKIGAGARELQHETLANINPAKGADSFRATKNMASILKGGPFTQEAYTGPNQLSTRMSAFKKGGNPFTSAVVDGVTSSAGTLGLGAGKALTSPWTRYGMQPLLRSYINERAADSNRYKTSPWQFIEDLKKGELK